MKYFFPAILIFTLAIPINGQLVINEFMASNSTVLADDAGEYDDWIEIYNTGNESVDLGGYYLTDNFSNPTKFDLDELPDIPANTYIIIYADEDGSQGYNHANFKLAREGESIAIVAISGSDTLFVDSLSYSEQVTDYSYGRYPDAAENYEFFTSPTPGSSNVSNNYLGRAPAPDFSLSGGFYTGSQSIDLSAELTGAEIRYTTNGSEPEEDDPIYSTLLTISNTTVVKARVFAKNYLPGPTITHSYFINEHFNEFDVSDRMSVVSISLDPDSVWGEEAGILYESNLWNEWEYAANIELFEPDGTTAFNQLAGIKLFGNSTRLMKQKSLAFIARNEYSSNRFAYKLFGDIPFEEYKSFVLRNGGNDWSQTYFRDALCHELVRNDMDIDAQGNRQSIVYINGEFYGIMNIKEKINEHYLEAHHDIDPDNIDMLQAEDVVVYGDGDAYGQFRGFVAHNDMTNPALYSYLEKQMDIREYMNLYIAQIYISNIDMSLNQKYWRERENYGKWRWIFYDTEMSFGQGDYSYTDMYGTIPSFNMVDYATISYGGSSWPHQHPWSSEKFISMLDNESFRDGFIQSFAVYLNTSFSTRRVLKVIDSLAHYVRMEMPYQIEKYGDVPVGFNPYGYHFSTMEEWEHHIDTLHNFAKLRPGYIREFLLNRFELEGTYELELTMDDPAYGTAFIQDIEMPLDSAGLYFDNVPLRIRVEPNSGYRFVKWTGAEISDSTSKEINLLISEDAIVEAVFAPEDDIMITEILYNSSANPGAEFIELYNPKHSTTADLSGYTLSGDISFTFPSGSQIKPMSYLVVSADSGLYSATLNKYQWESGMLDNSDGVIMLKNDQGDQIDSVNYLAVSPWPETMEDESIQLTAFTLDNTDGSNWETNAIIGGTAGLPVYDDKLQHLIINEVMSFNNNFIADEYNEYNDWIEILNTGTESVDIGGLFITNSYDTPDLYQIPTNAPEQTTIKPGEYKIIWADREPDQGPLHLSFNLNKGGTIAGISADGATFIDYTDTIVMIDPNLSFGRYPDSGNDWRTFDDPTPARYNSLPPEFISTPEILVESKTQYEYSIEVSDPEGDELIVGVLQLPAWLKYYPDEDPPNLSGRSPISRFEPQKVALFVTDGYTNPVSQVFEISRYLPGAILTNNEPGKVTVYPNPAQDIINILATTNSARVQLSIVNLSGQVIWNEIFNNLNGTLNQQIDLSGFKKGLYILSIKTDEEISTHKILLK